MPSTVSFSFVSFFPSSIVLPSIAIFSGSPSTVIVTGPLKPPSRVSLIGISRTSPWVTLRQSVPAVSSNSTIGLRTSNWYPLTRCSELIPPTLLISTTYVPGFVEMKSYALRSSAEDAIELRPTTLPSGSVTDMITRPVALVMLGAMTLSSTKPASVTLRAKMSFPKGGSWPFAVSPIVIGISGCWRCTDVLICF